MRDGEVTRGAGVRVDALYLRLDVELVDLVASDGRPIGAEIFEVAVAGGVVLANAPGNGVADDKAMYCYVPELIAYYLGEHPSSRRCRPTAPATRARAGSCSTGSASW